MAKPICKICKKSINTKKELVCWTYFSCYHRDCYKKGPGKGMFYFGLGSPRPSAETYDFGGDMLIRRVYLVAYAGILVLVGIFVIATGLTGNKPALCFSGLAGMALIVMLGYHLLLEKINKEYGTVAHKERE